MTSGQRGVWVLLSVVWLAGSSGCALTIDKIPLNYGNQPSVPKVRDAEHVTVTVSVRDERKDKTRVGCKKNGYGMEMAAIESTSDVPGFVRVNVEWELKRRGFVPGPGGAVVEVTLHRFYNDFKMGFFSGDAVAEFVMDVAVFKTTSGALPVFLGHYEGEGRNGGVQLSSGENAKVALDAAFDDAMRHLLNDRRFLPALAATSAPPPPEAPASAAPAPAAAPAVAVPAS